MLRRSVTHLVAAAVVFGALPGCGASTPRTPRVDRGATARLEVVNETVDPWDISVGGQLRGTVLPRARLVLRQLPPGHAALVARNARLSLTYVADQDLVAGRDHRWRLHVRTAKLSVINPHTEPLDIVMDGAVIGRAAAKATTTFEVPAGERTLIARRVDGPGAERHALFLTPGHDAVWHLPRRDAPIQGDPNLPRPPPGMGLVLMHNRTAHAVRVFVGAEMRARVGPRGSTTLVVPPGDHTLRVEVVGVGAESTYRVTLVPDQVAEWSYGEQ